MANSKANDEALLIDLALGRCDESEARELQRRLAQEPSLARLHDDVRNTFAAIGLATEHEPPETLESETMARIRAARQTDALLAREELSRRDVIRPTFSLRELGAVAGIVLLLVSIFGVSFREARRRQQIAECASQMARIGSGFQTYANMNGGYLPSAGRSERRWLPAADKPAVSNSAGPFRLVRAGYVKPTTFQCPAVSRVTYAVQAGMTDFPSTEAIGYSYHISLGERGLSIEDRRLAPVKASMVILADSTPLFDKARFRKERLRAAVSDNHDRTGQNVLYLDMHVDFKRQPSVGVMGDNIYLIENVFEYTGDEAPASVTDTFLAPSCSGGNVVECQQQPAPQQEH